MFESCSLCKRLVDRVSTRTPDGPVCTACYQREFEATDCTSCGARTRSYHGLQPATCKDCRPSAAKTCVRCAKPVAARSLKVEGGQACTYCRRFFVAPKPCANCGAASRDLAKCLRLGHAEPVCGKCRTADHKTCSACRKHRSVVALSEDGKPLCVTCSTGSPFVCQSCNKPGQRHSAVMCTECYCRQSLQLEAKRLSVLVERPWSQEMFDAFCAHWTANEPASGYLRKRLRRYSRFFVSLGQAFATREMITAERLVERIEVDRLRCMHVPYGWLVRNGYLPAVPTELAEVHAEAKAQERMLARMPAGWKRSLMDRYHAHLHNFKAVWRERGWRGDHVRFKERTVTVLMRAAVKFLALLPEDVVSTQGIDRGQLERFMVLAPGHKDSMHSFVSYLNRKEQLFQKLHIQWGGVHNFPVARLLTQAQHQALLDRWMPPYAGMKRRDALMCLLMLVYARTATQVCGLRRGLFAISHNGEVTAKFGPMAVPLDEDIGQMLKEHLTEVEMAAQRTLNDQDYIFPGVLPGRHFSTAGLQYVLLQQGVTAQQLFTTSVASFYREGLRSPKVLVRALGITDETAINYWQAFSQKAIEEMEFLAGRR